MYAVSINQTQHVKATKERISFCYFSKLDLLFLRPRLCQHSSRDDAQIEVQGQRDLCVCIYALGITETCIPSR